MRNWIGGFLDQYHSRTSRWPVVYTTTSWWQTCTGNYSGFADRSPLWLARYSSSPGPLPAGWPTYSIWQYASSGPLPGDQNVWNGSLSRLQVLACDGVC